MLYKKITVGAILFITLVFTGHAFAEWNRTEIAYWGASGTAHCNNYENVQIWVGMSYLHPDDALEMLWRQGVAACQYRGGLYDISGKAYCQWGPYW